MRSWWRCDVLPDGWPLTGHKVPQRQGLRARERSEHEPRGNACLPLVDLARPVWLARTSARGRFRASGLSGADASIQGDARARGHDQSDSQRMALVARRCPGTHGERRCFCPIAVTRRAYSGHPITAPSRAEQACRGSACRSCIWAGAAVSARAPQRRRSSHSQARPTTGLWARRSRLGRQRVLGQLCDHVLDGGVTRRRVEASSEAR